MKLKTLTRIKQCATCPWKKGNDPFDIPGYDLEKHKNLISTIAECSPLEQVEKINTEKNVKVMECHYSKDNEQPEYCIGYLHNQLFAGNNIALRLAMLDYNNVNEITVYGEQCTSFEDTLPSIS